MTTKARHEGYLLIDHSNAPAVDQELAVKNHVPYVAAGQRFESATITCSHCQRIVILNQNRTRERGYCAKCDHYICDNPLCHRDCIPFSQVMDSLQELATKNLNLDRKSTRLNSSHTRLSRMPSSA